MLTHTAGPADVGHIFAFVLGTGLGFAGVNALVHPGLSRTSHRGATGPPRIGDLVQRAVDRRGSGCRCADWLGTGRLARLASEDWAAALELAEATLWAEVERDLPAIRQDIAKRLAARLESYLAALEKLEAQHATPIMVESEAGWARDRLTPPAPRL